MFGQKIVFVVGAGASKEYGMPTGGELKERIASSLNFEHPTAGNPKFREIIEVRFAAERGKYLEAATELSKFILKSGKDSIDDILHWFSDRPEILDVGKAAIVHEILAAERKSSLFDEATPDLAPDKDFSSTWLTPFLTMSTESLSKKQTLEALFDNVTIINFNYDRTIEHFLVSKLPRQFDLGQAEAQTIVSRFASRILRPYGSVDRLPWQLADGNGTAFGHATSSKEHDRLFQLSKNVQTFTEGKLEEGVKNKIQTEISESVVVVFLGFGFHQQNMLLLKQTTVSHIRHVFGTMLHIDSLDKKHFEQRIGNTVGCQFPFALFDSAYCFVFLGKLKRTIMALTS